MVPPVLEAITAPVVAAEAVSEVSKGASQTGVPVPVGEGVLLLVLVAQVADPPQVAGVPVETISETAVPLAALVKAVALVASAKPAVLRRSVGREASPAVDVPCLGKAVAGT